MFGVDSHLLISVFAIFLFAGMVKGVLGFGLPIVTMSLLPFIMPIEKAIVISAVVQPATNVFQLISAGGLRKSLKLAWPVLLLLVPGVMAGAWYLSALDGKTLLLLVGLTIVAYSMFDFLGYKIGIPATLKVPAGMVFGFVAGVFGALTALNGWAFIMYLTGLNVSRDTFRSTIALLFIVSGFLISSSFWIIGWLDKSAALLGALALLGAFPGMSIGNYFGAKISGDFFRKLILVALFGIGIMLSLQGLS
ncbi:MAG: sulfite exporter TauE/SafE family protein [Pseudomonadota bacterium]